MEPNTSNVVLLSMITYLQQELNASERLRERAENIASAQQEVVHTLYGDLRAADETMERLSQGTSIVNRAIDQMYDEAKTLYLANKIGPADWDQFYRAMMRADIGYAIIHGVNFVDLTADEQMEPEVVDLTEIDTEAESDDEETEDED